jgi:hypothetical protein
MVTVGIEGGANAFEGGDELGDAFEGEVLGLHGNDQGVGGDQDVEREQVERRRAVENHQVEAGLNGLRRAQAKCAIVGGGQLDVGAGEVL